MEKLSKINNLINWRNFEYLNILSIEKISDNNIHLEFENVGVVLFLVNDTELNGVVYANSDEFINALG